MKPVKVTYKNIETLLKSGLDVRITCSNRWLVWNEDINQWVVYEHKKYHRYSDQLINTKDLPKALEVLSKNQD